MRSHLDCRRPRGDAAGERVRPAAPDPRPHASLLGAGALDGERAFNNDHHLVGAIPLAQRPALDALLVSLAARRTVDPLPRRRSCSFPPTRMMSSSPVGANITTQTTKRSLPCSG